MLRRLLWIGMLLLFVGCQQPPQQLACFRPLINTPTTQLATGERLVMLDRILAIEPAPTKPITLQFALVNDPLTRFSFNFNQKNNHVKFVDLENFFHIKPVATLECQDTFVPQSYSFVLEIISNTKTYTQPFDVSYQADINDFNFYDLRFTQSINVTLIMFAIIAIGLIFLLTMYSVIWISIFRNKLYTKKLVITILLIKFILVIFIFHIDFYNFNQKTTLYCYSMITVANEKYQPLGEGIKMFPNGIQSQDIDLNFYPLYTDLSDDENNYMYNDSRYFYRFYFKHMPALNSVPTYPNCNREFNDIHIDMYLFTQNNEVSIIPIIIKPLHKDNLDNNISFIRSYDFAGAMLTLSILAIPMLWFIRSQR
ncbi:hypothetical protein [Herpetosiphon giganteus]|uniref:hypothetical protein n=1 Tax=Herpetosiphon giganteus TaxID=2029754 RepID=UPI0019562126|nr:hypothetical protein [Herpetosiphon giganteus]MBM7841967.1 hypothetical protein [Herpetosiphon giganteus]